MPLADAPQRFERVIIIPEIIKTIRKSIFQTMIGVRKK